MKKTVILFMVISLLGACSGENLKITLKQGEMVQCTIDLHKDPLREIRWEGLQDATLMITAADEVVFLDQATNGSVSLDMVQDRVITISILSLTDQTLQPNVRFVYDGGQEQGPPAGLSFQKINP